jgi:hypothetical protein
MSSAAFRSCPRLGKFARWFDSLAAQAQTVLGQDPFSGHVFCFRGRRGNLVKLLCLFAEHPGPPGPATPSDQLGPVSQP